MRILTAGLQVWNLQKFGFYITKWLFVHHSLSTCSQDGEASIYVLQRASGLVMASYCLPLSTSYGTITKYSCVCCVFILCTLHPPCWCYSIIVWLASLQQKQREPSPLTNSEIAGYGAWCSAPSPRGAVFHFLHWTSKMLARKSDYVD